ncbi:MAG: glycosyltransferase [Kiritimatiellae bacterium]|nr:glycosyltransferase [Kiritimatiellia bacterium]
MPKFSVIVPVYNGERYLERCLESIVRSIGEARDWEIVCVDDASTDRTAEILANFSKSAVLPCRLARHEENRGLGESRNTGLENACGEWIAWVDADDEVTTEWASMIRRQTAAASSDDAPDVLCFGAWMEKDGMRRQMMPRRAPWTGAAEDFLKDIVLDLGSSTWMWNKVFRRSLFEGLRFSGRCLEDFRLMPAILARAKVARTLAEPLYVYHRPAGSLTRKGDCSGYREGLEAAAALTWRETAGGLGADFPRVWREGMCLRIADFLRNIGESAEMRRYLRRQLGLVLGDGRQSLRVKVKCILAAVGI